MLTDKEREYSRRHYAKYRERIQAERKEYYKNNPGAYHLKQTKYRAKKLGLDFSLDVSDFDVPEFCPILGLKLEYSTGKGPAVNSPSIDRIDPNIGYVKGNVRIISNRANTLKNNMTLEEAKAVYEDLLAICQIGHLQDNLVPVEKVQTRLL